MVDRIGCGFGDNRLRVHGNTHAGAFDHAQVIGTIPDGDGL